MNYKELIAMALKGRSVNSVAKEWGLNQPTLQRYVTEQRLPDFDTAEKIAKAAGVDKATAFEVFAAAERLHKIQGFKLKKQQGFVQISILASGAGMCVVILSILC